MKVGDLVRPKHANSSSFMLAPIVQENWVGIVIALKGSGYPVVYWNPVFKNEIEFPDQVEVIS